MSSWWLLGVGEGDRGVWERGIDRVHCQRCRPVQVDVKDSVSLFEREGSSSLPESRLTIPPNKISHSLRG
uniref:Uncharacterized protein n=1 Tax=Callorhinchus milii TaxID=7868 RepID=A0A4W3HQE6_CALMI